MKKIILGILILIGSVGFCEEEKPKTKIAEHPEQPFPSHPWKR